jgi:hypothetical protein
MPNKLLLISKEMERIFLKWVDNIFFYSFGEESNYHPVMAEKGGFLPTNNKLTSQHFKKNTQFKIKPKHLIN